VLASGKDGLKYPETITVLPKVLENEITAGLIIEIF
jgi:hypothetical protein